MSTSPWLASFPSTPQAAVRLLCLPHAGGGIVGYRAFAQALGPTVAVQAVQLPGREMRVREEPAASLAELLDPLVDAIAPLADGLPMVIFGHSFGAIVAYELVQRLWQDLAIAPHALVVSGRVAPHLPGRAPRLSHLPPRDVVFRISEMHRNIPVALLEQPDYVAMIGRALRADLHLLEHYPRTEFPPLPCPIDAYRGTSDAYLDADELQAWAQHTRGGFRVTPIEGDHFYFTKPAGAQALFAGLRERCAAAAEERT